MPGFATDNLRIYCICGQKMKVSPAMYGRPGKCVACRQKIRIPRLEEIPADGQPLYLKDHPELLRGPRPAAASASAAVDEPSEDPEEFSLGSEELDEEAESLERTPLVTLAPLQLLCNFDDAIHHQLDAFRLSSGTPEGSAADKATLMGYRALLKSTRNGLDEELRAKLVAAGEELSATVERISQATLALRIGEIDYQKFRATVAPLRRQREVLEWRRQNIRGWLATHDPYMAGGRIEVRLENVPCEGLPIKLPPEPYTDGLIADQLLEHLRSAIKAREKIAHRLAGFDRVPPGADTSAQAELPAKDSRAALEAEQCRIRATVAFFRRRLDQAVQDCDSDIRAIKANIEVIRSQFEKQTLDEASYQAMELELLRAQSDNSSMRDLALRAIRATKAVQVPLPRGTFLKRISKPTPTSGVTVDCWLAWLGSGTMLACIFVLMLSQRVYGGILDFQGASLVLFVSALLLAILAFIPKREMRGALIAVCWVCACIAGFLFLHEARYSENALGSALRMAPSPALRLEVGLFVFCAFMAGTPVFAALMPLPRHRKIPLLSTLIVLLSLWAIQTDAAGLFLPRPAIGEAAAKPEDTRQNLYEVSIPVFNEGRRPFWLGGRLDVVPTPVKYALERRVGPDLWENVLNTRPDGTDSDAHDFRRTPLKLTGGGLVNLPYRLSPGVYRVRLSSAIPGFEQIESSFTLEPITVANITPPPLPRLAPPAIPGLDIVAGEENTEPEETEGAEERETAVVRDSRPSGIEIVLRGVITGEGRPPRFVVDVTRRSGVIKRLTLSLGEVVYGPWAAYEFSPGNKTLTLSDGDRLVILQRGQPEVFPEVSL